MPEEPGDVAPGMPLTGTVEPHRGTLVLVFGVLGLVICFIFAILALVWGNRDLAKMRAGMMDPAGEEYTRWGRLLGIISLAWHTVEAVAGTIWALINRLTILEWFQGA